MLASKGIKGVSYTVKCVNHSTRVQKSKQKMLYCWPTYSVYVLISRAKDHGDGAHNDHMIDTCRNMSTYMYSGSMADASANMVGASIKKPSVNEHDKSDA